MMGRAGQGSTRHVSLSRGTQGSRSTAGTQHMAQTRPTGSASPKHWLSLAVGLALSPAVPMSSQGHGAQCHLQQIPRPCTEVTWDRTAPSPVTICHRGPFPSLPLGTQEVRAHRSEFIFILISSERCRKKRISGELCACSHHTS